MEEFVRTWLCVKPEVTSKDLEKFGFKGRYWKPSFTAQEYEKEYYPEEAEYFVRLDGQHRQVVIYPNEWFMISSKIQCLIFEMTQAGLLEEITDTIERFKLGV